MRPACVSWADPKKQHQKNPPRSPQHSDLTATADCTWCGSGLAANCPASNCIYRMETKQEYHLSLPPLAEAQQGKTTLIFDFSNLVWGGKREKGGVKNQ